MRSDFLKSPIRVAFILPSLSREAPIFVAIAIAEYLVSRGVIVSIYYFKGLQQFDINGVSKIEKINFFSKIDFKNYDIIHSHLFVPDLYTAIYKFFSLNSKMNSVSTLHNYVYEELRNYKGRFFSVFFGTIWNMSWLNKTRLYSLTEHSLKYYQRIGFNKNIKPMYNGRNITIDYESFDDYLVKRICLLKKRKRFLIGTYCNLIKRKNVEILIDYAACNESCGVVIFGDGPEKGHLTNLINHYGLEHSILLFDAVPNAHQYNFFFDIYAMTSKSEGFGLAIIEAALHKKNIICTDIDVFHELFSDDEVTFFMSENLDSFSKAVDIALISNYKSNHAYIKASEKYSEEMMGRRYFEDYCNLLNGKI